MYKKKKKKKKKSTLWPRRSDEVYVKSRESQKNHKNNEVITITSARVCEWVVFDETHTHVHTTATHIRTHTGTHLDSFLFIIAGFSQIHFFRSLHHCGPVTPLRHSFIPLFIRYFCNYILIPFYNLYAFTPVGEKNSKKSEIMTSRSVCVLARDRGFFSIRKIERIDIL